MKFNVVNSWINITSIVKSINNFWILMRDYVAIKFSIHATEDENEKLINTACLTLVGAFISVRMGFIFATENYSVNMKFATIILFAYLLICSSKAITFQSRGLKNTSDRMRDLPIFWRMAAQFFKRGVWQFTIKRIAPIIFIEYLIDCIFFRPENLAFSIILTATFWVGIYSFWWITYSLYNLHRRIDKQDFVAQDLKKLR